ncbi:MAG: CoA transferase subunit A [Defluviitaleaceae bacterium]|nr:CoA transferase subunit A [Defluviitaleaceae bacterium]
MNKIISVSRAIDFIKDGDTIMIGGFLTNGTPERLVDALVASGKKNLTLISSDTGFVDKGVGKLVVNKQCKKIYASHIGTNKETGRQMTENETEVVLVPQGSLVEKIRAAGYGLGGVLTPTGLGTLVAEGKEKLTIDGKEYLLELPLHADVALIYADQADKEGNLLYKGSAANFNSVMAAAAKTTIVETNNLVDSIDPNYVHTPSVFVNHIVS